MTMREEGCHKNPVNSHAMREEGCHKKHVTFHDDEEGGMSIKSFHLR